MLKRLCFPFTLACALLTGACGLSPSEASAGTTQPSSWVASTQPLTASLEQSDPTVQPQIQEYIDSLVGQGFARAGQGVWIQSGNTLLANVQGTVPLPAASLTKVATSLAALQILGSDYQFITQFGATGSVQNGVLEGNLVVQGAEDPFFVWEEAVAVGNLLNQLGIRQVKGNLVIVGKFYMNFYPDPQKSGELLKQGLNAQSWPSQAETQYRTLPAGTPRPQVAIQGSVQIVNSPPAQVRLLVRHTSLPLTELLKKMNRYSNNIMAEMVARRVGGAAVVARTAATTTGIPAAEFQLKNGSGLGEDNRMSPRAICALFLAIERLLQPKKLTIGDVFAVVGRDEGVLEKRLLPPLLVTKSGTLDTVSTLAGALPTQKQGIIWFTIMNGGSDLVGFRTKQGVLLQSLLSRWVPVTTLPPELAPNLSRAKLSSQTEPFR